MHPRNKVLVPPLSESYPELAADVEGSYSDRSVRYEINGALVDVAVKGAPDFNKYTGWLLNLITYGTLACPQTMSMNAWFKNQTTAVDLVMWHRLSPSRLGEGLFLPKGVLPCTTGDFDFDKSFEIKSTKIDFVRHLFDSDMRMALKELSESFAHEGIRLRYEMVVPPHDLFSYGYRPSRRKNGEYTKFPLLTFELCGPFRGEQLRMMRHIGERFITKLTAMNTPSS